MSPSEPTPLPPGVPTFLYGTAWKEDATAGLVRMALDAGFRGIDTANQRRHYHEAGVGAAIAAAFEDGLVARDEIFLQTKFTHVAGQDHRLPYDPNAAMAEQVAQSFASSREHLGVDTIDSYVLHGPSLRVGLADEDIEAWRAMETVHSSGKTRFLGISNVSREQLETLCDLAEVKPTFVQNRCYAQFGWDREVRELCRERGMVYQGFSLLTANRGLVEHPRFVELAEGLGAAPAQVVFRFAQRVGMLPLTGTTDPAHAALDLAAEALELSDELVELVEGAAG